MTKSSRDLSKQPGVWLRPDVIGIDVASRPSPCGPSTWDVLGRLAISAPLERWFRGQQWEYVLDKENLSSTRRSVVLAGLGLSSVCRGTALNGLELVVLDGADPSGGREGTALSRHSQLGGREGTALIREASARHWQVDVKGLR